MRIVNILDRINVELKGLAKNPSNLKDYSRFHKDGKAHIGIATPLVRKLSSKYFKEVKNFQKKQIFSLCEKLLETNDSCYQDIAFDWAFRIKKQYQKEDFNIYEDWLKNYVNTWGSCDDLCTHAFGNLIFQFPELLPRTKRWAKSSNKWFRRASAVVLIYSLRKGKYLQEAIDAANLLTQDNEDLVQKGNGWMLKEASKHFRGKVFAYVMKKRFIISRVALRYAIEKLPKKMRQKALSG